MALPGQFEVGQLYLGFNRNGLPVWTQPGGVGTTVYPQLPQLFPEPYQGYNQWPFSYPAQYYFGCGHPLNCPELQEVYDPYAEVQVMLLMCPMCSFIQEIYSPASAYYDYVQTPIVVA